MIQRRFNTFIEILDLETLHNGSPATKLVVLKMINYVQDLLKRESRHLLCTMGEKCANSVLSLFEENETDSEVIRFFRFQMSFHHPRGARNVREGAYFVKEEIWRHILPKIYSNLIDATIANKKRRNRYKSSKNYALSNEEVDLAVQVGKQVFCGDNSPNLSVDLTQIVPIDTTQADDLRPPNKKRKLDISLQTCIFDHFKRSSDDHEEVIVPWLQIFAKLIAEINLELIEPKFEKNILELMQSCRTIPVKSLILECMTNLVKRVKSDSRSWQLFWEDAVNSVKLNQCLIESHALLRTLLESHLFKDTEPILNLYFQKRIKCSKASILTLIEILRLRPQNAENRKKLLDWITDDYSMYEKTMKTSRKTLVEIFTILIIHPTYIARLPRQKIFSFESEYAYLETKILESNQRILPEYVHKPEEQCKGGKISVCEKMKSNLKDSLIRHCGIVLDDLVKQPEILEKFQNVTDQCSLVMNFIKNTENYGLNLNDKRLETVSANLLNKCAEILIKICKQCKKSVTKAAKCLLPHLDMWIKFFESFEGHLETDAFYKVSEAIFDLLDSFDTKEINGTAKQNGASQNNASESLPDDFSDEETDEINDVEMLDANESLENENLLVVVTQKCLVALGHGFAHCPNDVSEFMDELKIIAGNSNIDEVPKIFGAIEAFFHSNKDPEQNLKILGILQKLVKILLMDASFDPHLLKKFLQFLTKSIEFLKDSVGHEQEKTNVKKFAIGLFRIQKSFQRFSRDLDKEFVKFLTKLACCDTEGNYFSKFTDAHNIIDRPHYRNMS